MNAVLQSVSGWVSSKMAPVATALPVGLGDRGSYSATPRSAQVRSFDQPLVWVVVTLLMWGVVMVYSASIAMPDNPKFSNYTHTHFLVRHVVSIGVALVAALIAFQVPVQTWEKVAPLLFIASLVLLILVLVPFIGKGVNGARRWIALGILNFQPSELAKFAVLLYASDYMVRKMEVKEKFFRAVMPMGFAVAFVGLLLLAEPDMGAFMVIAVIAMGILFLGGVNARMFFLIAAVLVVAFGLMIALSEWRRERIFAYLDPWTEKHALGKGYQLSHSLIAIGWQCGETALAARGAHRLLTGCNWRRVWPDRRDHCDRPVSVAHPSHDVHRSPGHCLGPRVCRFGGARRGHLDRVSVIHQYGREPGRIAHERPDLAAHELRRLGHFDQPYCHCGSAAH
jgi:cell division protein FtsW